MMKLTILSLPITSIAILLAGCTATAPTYEQFPKEELLLKENWVAQLESTTSLADSLVELFNDTNLRTLVQQSQQHNLSLIQQKYATEAVASTVTQTKAALKPEITTGLVSNKQQDSEANIFESHTLALDVSWELDLWGRWGAERDAAILNLAASTATYQALQDSIAAQTMQAYMDAVSQSQQAALSNEQYLSFEKTLSVVHSQYRAGTAELDELTEARQRLAGAKVDRIENQLQQRNAIRALQVLTGSYPDGLDFVGTTLPILLTAPSADVPASILTRRPDVQSAWYSVQSAASSAAAKDAARLPNIVLTSELGSVSDALKNILSGNTIWSVAASIGYTLFDNGSLNAQLAESQNLAEQSYYQYLEIVLTALNEVESALDAEYSYHAREIAQREAVTQAHLLLANAEQDYRDGLIDITDWLTYQRSYFDEKAVLIDTLNQRLQNRVSLGLALGLGI